MISTSDGSQAKAKAFLKDKSQKIMEYMPELQRHVCQMLLLELRVAKDQSIRAKVQKGTIKIL